MCVSDRIEATNGKKFVTFDPRTLQYTDPTTRSVGTTAAARAPASAPTASSFGERSPTSSLPLARSVADPATLLDADAQSLLAPARRRFRRASSRFRRRWPPALRLRIPSTAARRHHVARPSRRYARHLTARTLTTYVGYTKDGALNFTPLSAPTASGDTRPHARRTGTLDNFVGPGRRVFRARARARCTTGRIRTPRFPAHQSFSALPTQPA
jgi:hypothetical protein